MSTEEHISTLERLAKLKAEGAIDEADFQAQKTRLMGSSAAKVPFYRKLWFVVFLTCILLTFPIAFLILATGEVYKKASDGTRIPIKKSTRYIYAGLLALWFTALVIRSSVDPNYWKMDWNAPSVSGASSTTNTSSTTSTTSNNSANTPSTTASAQDEIGTCDDADMIEKAKVNFAETSASSLTDFANPKQLVYDKKNGIRFCGADASYNDGGSVFIYKIYKGPSGKTLVLASKSFSAFFGEMQFARASEKEQQAEDKVKDIVNKAKALPAQNIESELTNETNELDAVNKIIFDSLYEEQRSDFQSDIKNWTDEVEKECLPKAASPGKENANQGRCLIAATEIRIMGLKDKYSYYFNKN